MIKFELDKFHRAIASMQHTRTSINDKKSHKAQPDGGLIIEPITDRVFLGLMSERGMELLGLLNDLGAEVTTKAVEEFIRGLVGVPTYEALATDFDTIQVTLNREIESSMVLALTREENALYAPRRPLFGEDFEEKFKTNGVFELDEAAKCRALGRPTASVFHLMRIMEVVIRAMARCLGIPDPLKPAERNWGIINGEIWKEIERRWPTAAARMHGDGSLFEGLYASLDAVKNPWRNATMHVEKKYTETEAEDIFAAVRGFTRQLAARMDEDGKPVL